MNGALVLKTVCTMSFLFGCTMQAKSQEDNLFQALKSRDISSVKRLISYGVMVKDEMIKATLMYLLGSKKSSDYQEQKDRAEIIIQVLVSHGAQPTVRDYIMAASENMINLIRDWTFTCDNAFTFGTQTQAALNAAVVYNAYDVAHYLLDHGVSPNVQGESYPLEVAVLAYYNLHKPTKLEFIKFLLDHGAIVSNRVYQEAQGVRWKYPAQLRPGATNEKIKALEQLLAEYHQ